MMTIRTASWTLPMFAVFATVEPLTCMPGQEVVVAGVTPSGYDGTFVVISCGGHRLQVFMEADPGPYVSGGTIT